MDLFGDIKKAVTGAVDEVTKRVDDVTDGRRLDSYEIYSKNGKRYSEVEMLQRELATVKDSADKPYYSGKVDGKLGDQQALGKAMIRYAADNDLKISAEADDAGNIINVRIPDETRTALSYQYSQSNPKVAHPNPRSHAEVIADETTKGVGISGGSGASHLDIKCPTGVPASVCNAIERGGR